MEPQAGLVAKACALSLPFTQLAWVGLGPASSLLPGVTACSVALVLSFLPTSLGLRAPLGLIHHGGFLVGTCLSAWLLTH